jgi:hypothetical protein
MKRNVFLLFFIALVLNSLSAQELQFSFGPETSLFTYKVDRDIAFINGSSGYFFNENTDSFLFASGINFSMRRFDNNDSISKGFFFRDRAIFVTNMAITGKYYSDNGGTLNINESYSIKDMDSFISIMDFDFGTSSRFIISKRLQFYADLGINFTIMDSESDDTADTLSYWGAGIYANLALQVNLTKMVYLEFGMPAIINLFSSQKGTDDLRPLINKTVNYKDSGRFDSSSVSFYINVGWRIDPKTFGNKPPNNNIDSIPNTAE